MTGTLITVVLWALPVALLLWVLLLLARSIARRGRSGVEGVVPGMTAYGADDHVIGVVDAVAPNGLQVGGQFIAGNAVRRVARDRVDLARPSVAFSRGVGPLASDDEATPIRVSTTPGPPDVRVYQDIGGDRGRRRARGSRGVFRTQGGHLPVIPVADGFRAVVLVSRAIRDRQRRRGGAGSASEVTPMCPRSVGRGHDVGAPIIPVTWQEAGGGVPARGATSRAPPHHHGLRQFRVLRDARPVSPGTGL